MHVLGLMSTLWPHHESNRFVLSKQSILSLKTCENDVDLESVRLVDNAFSRVCVRLQDSSRRVRQLAAEIMSDLAKVSFLYIRF